ncbi:LOB domain-containing protein 13-like [Lucilia sericata]|uniref:LOB domain-containing protein 13-like n=1 Tax=Lucilia sericata TaxID=13632 RepID=UPI0018A7F488|nr:LOB domain-containing protein 13-like [Lucilia sericata]
MVIKKINWPKNRIQHYNHYQQQHEQQPLTEQQQQQEQQQQHHYSSINPNSSTEQFAVIDENERHGRTFTFITDLINSFTQPTCIYPCTLDAYQQRRCCETVVVVPQPPPNVCCQPPLAPRPPPTVVIRPPIPIRPPSVLPPPPPLQPFPSPTFPLIPTQCCTTCPTYGYYGPPPCIRYTIPAGGPGRVSLYMG